MSGPGLQAVRVVGGLVPPGLFGRIQADEVHDPDSLSPRSYHLPGRETVRDAANRSWTYLRGAWRDWRNHTTAQPPGSAGTGPARERWLLVLLRELGYGQLPALRGGLEVDGVEYPVSHAWQHVPVHLLGPGVELDRRNPGVAGAARAPQAMVQELLNRTEQHLWAVLSNGLRLRLLRDSTAWPGRPMSSSTSKRSSTGSCSPSSCCCGRPATSHGWRSAAGPARPRPTAGWRHGATRPSTAAPGRSTSSATAWSAR